MNTPAVIFLVGAVVSAGLTPHLAEAKGYGGNRWFWLGLLFGIFALWS